MKLKDFKKDLKTKDEKELKKILGDLRKKLLQLRIELATGKLKNVKEIEKTKKMISWVLTFLNATKINKIKNNKS